MARVQIQIFAYNYALSNIPAPHSYKPFYAPEWWFGSRSLANSQLLVSFSVMYVHIFTYTMHLLFLAAPTSVSSTGSSSLHCFMNSTESDNVPGRLTLSVKFYLFKLCIGHNWRKWGSLPNWAVLFCTPGLATTINDYKMLHSKNPSVLAVWFSYNVRQCTYIQIQFVKQR